MSKETTRWLNANVMQGFTEDASKWAAQPYAVARKTAEGDTTWQPWFADDDYTGRFSGAVPVEAVMERLLNWQAVKAPAFSDMSCDIDEATNIGVDGKPTHRQREANYAFIKRSDNGFTMNCRSDDYQVHQYNEWFIDNIANMLHGELAIESAGLLMGGGVFWVSVSLPESFSTSSGFALRPRILGYGSHNSKFTSSYMRNEKSPICDNSLDVEIAGRDRHSIKVRHSAKSMGKLAVIRDALGLLYAAADEDLAFFERLAEWDVQDREFKGLMDQLYPVPAAEVVDGKVKNQRSITMAESRREDIATMYVMDDRASKWRGSALGVLQAFNTWDQQERSVMGERFERQMLGSLSGQVATFNNNVLGGLADVCGVDLGKLVAA